MKQPQFQGLPLFAARFADAMIVLYILTSIIELNVVTEKPPSSQPEDFRSWQLMRCEQD